MLNLSYLLEFQAREYPDRTAVIFNDTRLSYGQLNVMANQFANGLASLGVKPGDKVALMMPNIPYFPIAYYGILKTGATVVPFNVLFKGREVAYHIKDSDSVALVVFEGFAQHAYDGFQQVDSCHTMIVATADPKAPSPVEGEGVMTMGQLMYGKPATFDTHHGNPHDTAVILYTSGTTGSPKGAELTHSNMVLNAITSSRLADGNPSDIYLATLPLFHSFGQTVVMNAAFFAGAAVTMLPRFKPEDALGIMERDNVTVFAGVPTMYWAMMSYPEADKFDLEKIARNLKVCISGGAALPLEVLRGFEKKFDVPILEGYGLSETSPAASFNVRDKQRKPGSIGVPVWGTEMKIVDPETDEEKPVGEVGEVVIRGHQVMKGYYKKPEATAKAMRNGWFHTGDLGRMDEDGYFYIVDRLKEMIIRGGFNVYPREIEEYLITHPKISLVAVKGVPDEKYGEEIKAYVVLKPGETMTVEEFIEFAKKGLADYKYPRIVEFRSELPMTATGKILKRELKD